jgi:hypothetical protein
MEKRNGIGRREIDLWREHQIAKYEELVYDLIKLIEKWEQTEHPNLDLAIAGLAHELKKFRSKK